MTGDYDDHDVNLDGGRDVDADTNEVGEEQRGKSGTASARREVYLSRTVYRDGSAVSLEQVLVIDDGDDDDEEGDDPPDRDVDPYLWEVGWREIQRADLRAISGRWRGRQVLERRRWYCLICGIEMEPKPRGRKPKTCSARCRKRLERRMAGQMSRNAPSSRGTMTAKRPTPPSQPCTCSRIKRERVNGFCPRHGIGFEFITPEPSGLRRRAAPA